MNIDNARELKALLTGQVTQPLPTPNALAVKAFARALGSPGTFGLAAQPLGAVGVVSRTMAVGLVKKSAKNDYHLAVRLQRHSLADSPALERIRELAKREIDVRYIGKIVKRAVPWYQKRCRPLRIGCSIGHYKITAGTLGCFVRDRETRRQLILSNNHVLANENVAKQGDAILQPGSYDGGIMPADIIGKLERFVRLKKSATNLVDAAVSTIDEGIAIRPKPIKGHGTVAGLGPPFLDEGTLVWKLGRTTGLRKGRVTAFELDNVVVGYGIGNLRFDDQVEIEGADKVAFSDGGDSGSLIVDADGQGVALLFAGGDVGGTNGQGLTYANPLGTVLDALKVDLL